MSNTELIGVMEEDCKVGDLVKLDPETGKVTKTKIPSLEAVKHPLEIAQSYNP